LDGWRVPNVNEMQSLLNADKINNALWLALQGFIFPINIDRPFWTSTSSADNPTINAWAVDMVDGSVFPDNKGFTYFVWPVRGTSNPLPPADIPPGQIAETGQVTKYAPIYDDAYFATTPGQKVGVPWPADRFTTTYCDSTGPCSEQLLDCDAISSNNMVVDNLTGLMWAKDADIDGSKTWDNALIFTNDISVCGFVDWRLPNTKELSSLIDRSKTGPALPTPNPFANIRIGSDEAYWASTSYAFNPSEAWTVDMLLGGLAPRSKTQPAFVWPVRGGETRPYVLTVTRLGDGKGTISGPELTCVGKVCTGDYASYDVITITATAQSGSAFTEWGNCPAPSANTCTITVTDDIDITATFLPEYKISVNPKSLNFKNLKQGVESSPLSVTVKNIGVADLLLFAPIIAGNNPTVFGQTNDCPSTGLAAMETCTITVTATSPDYDQKTAELQISSNDPKNATVIVKLKAKAKPPKISKKPGALNFGKVAIGSPSIKTLTLTNKGVTDLQIPFGGVISVTNPTDFSFSPASCPTLAAKESCTLTITFTPSTEGKLSAVLNIPSNDPKTTTLSVKLQGTGQ
jgi:hypothetical protein